MRIVQIRLKSKGGKFYGNSQIVRPYAQLNRTKLKPFPGKTEI